MRGDRVTAFVKRGIWEPKRGHIWMKRWLETHRMWHAARQAMERIRAQHHRYRQLAFDFNFDTWHLIPYPTYP